MELYFTIGEPSNIFFPLSLQRTHPRDNNMEGGRSFAMIIAIGIMQLIAIKIQTYNCSVQK